MTSPGNTIGGGSASTRNVITGNTLAQISLSPLASRTQILGNYIGVNATGTAALGVATNRPDGISIASDNNTVGDGSAGSRNLISGNNYGISIAATQATFNAIQGNSIGTDVNGAVAIPNVQYGVYIAGAANNTIGGTDPSLGNLISGNSLAGIFVQGAGSNGTRIFGNQIGTSAVTALTGIPNGTGTNGVGGIHLLNNSYTLVGFTNPTGNTDAGVGYANTIAFNRDDGVRVDNGSGAGIFTNSIFANTFLGIDLVNGGNANLFQPFITSVDTTPTSTLISGQFNGNPGVAYRLQFFTNASVIAGTLAQGETFIGDLDVTATGFGFTTFNALLPTVSVATGVAVTATVSQQPLVINNTSQFSGPVAAKVSTTPDLAVTIATNPTALQTGQNFSYVYTVTNSGPTPAPNTRLNVRLPDGVRYSFSANGPFQTTSSTVLNLNLGMLAPNATSTTTIYISKPDVALASLTTSAVVSSALAETNPGNNSATLTSTFNPVADLRVVLTPPTDKVAVGASFSYQVTIVNIGPNIAGDAFVTVQLPSSLTNVMVGDLARDHFECRWVEPRVDRRGRSRGSGGERHDPDHGDGHPGRDVQRRRQNPRS